MDLAAILLNLSGLHRFGRNIFPSWSDLICGEYKQDQILECHVSDLTVWTWEQILPIWSDLRGIHRLGGNIIPSWSDLLCGEYKQEHILECHVSNWSCLEPLNQFCYSLGSNIVEFERASWIWQKYFPLLVGFTMWWIQTRPNLRVSCL